jgi:hypothetical protein
MNFMVRITRAISSTSVAALPSKEMEMSSSDLPPLVRMSALAPVNLYLALSPTTKEAVGLFGDFVSDGGAEVEMCDGLFSGEGQGALDACVDLAGTATG